MHVSVCMVCIGMYAYVSASICMYYVLICIRLHLLVLHVLVCIAYICCICIGVYQYVLSVLACMACIGVYCKYWCVWHVLVCIVY